MILLHVYVATKPTALSLKDKLLDQRDKPGTGSGVRNINLGVVRKCFSPNHAIVSRYCPGMGFWPEVYGSAGPRNLLGSKLMA
jgi:hypothetical protein